MLLAITTKLTSCRGGAHLPKPVFWLVLVEAIFVPLVDNFVLSFVKLRPKSFVQSSASALRIEPAGWSEPLSDANKIAAVILVRRFRERR